MADSRFPQIAYPYPEKLRTVADRVRDYELAPLNGDPVKLWDRFIQKLESGQKINNTERVIGITSSNLIPSALLSSFTKRFVESIDPEFLGKLGRKIIPNLAPEPGIHILLSVPEAVLLEAATIPRTLVSFKVGRTIFSHGALANFIVGQPDPLRAFIEAALTPKGTDISKGQEKLLTVLQANEAYVRFFSHGVRELSEYLFVATSSENEAAEHLDRFLGLYLSATPNWETEVLSSNKPIGILLTWLRNQSQERQRILLSKRSLKEVVAGANRISEVLNELANVELARAAYWRLKLEYCSFVTPRRFKRGNAKVGVAFGIGEYVIVEFAPVGNAAFLYRAEDFENNIRSSDSWRKPEFGQSYPGLTTAGTPGQIPHRIGWESILDRLLEAIKK